MGAQVQRNRRGLTWVRGEEIVAMRSSVPLGGSVGFEGAVTNAAADKT